jgi:serpin B
MWIYLVIALIVIYVAYRWLKSDSSSQLKLKIKSMFSTDVQCESNKEYMAPLNPNGPLDKNTFLRINKVIDRDALDYNIFNRIKNRRSTLYSSLSLREALLFIYLGTTQNSNCWNMFNRMFNNMDDRLMLSFHNDLNKHLIQTNKIKIANSIWYDNTSFQLYPAYKNLVQSIAECHAPIQQAMINDWVAFKTEGMINTLDIPADIKLVVLNALYFHDKWKNKFNINDTYQSRFVSWDGHETEIHMMTQKNEFMYTEDDSAQAILLDYNSPFSMLIILPTDGSEPLPLTHDNVRNLISIMTMNDVTVHLPRFTISDTHQLLEPLIDLGYSYIKDDDYSRMIVDNPRRIIIEQIIQKTKIDVDENGTTAAAVTGIMSTNSASPNDKQNIMFKADHSFLFYIIHRPTVELLFSGIFNGSN